jgi:prepilin-type N-terminal cleavage/methylation domain-containing protein
MKNKSFTLIELLVVIVIIGILAGVIMISTSSSINKANIAKSKVFEESIKDKLLLNLVSEWSFDTGPTQANSLAVSDDIKDIWGSYNAQIGPYAPTVKNGEDCISGKCLYFDGNDCIYVAGHNAFDIENEITVSVWVFPQEMFME